MKRRNWILATSVLFVAVVIAAIWLAGGRRKFVYEASVVNPITQADALHFAERALVDAGLAEPDMEPVPYGPDSEFADPETAERFFARNRINADAGYVMWSHRYTVHLEQADGSVICRLSRMK